MQYPKIWSLVIWLLNKLHVYHQVYQLSVFHMLKSYIITIIMIISKLMYTLNWQVYSDYAMLHVFCMYGIPKYTPLAYTLYSAAFIYKLRSLRCPKVGETIDVTFQQNYEKFAFKFFNFFFYCFCEFRGWFSTIVSPVRKTPYRTARLFALLWG